MYTSIPIENAPKPNLRIRTPNNTEEEEYETYETSKIRFLSTNVKNLRRHFAYLAFFNICTNTALLLTVETSDIVTALLIFLSSIFLISFTVQWVYSYPVETVDELIREDV